MSTAVDCSVNSVNPRGRFVQSGWHSVPFSTGPWLRFVHGASYTNSVGGRCGSTSKKWGSCSASALAVSTFRVLAPRTRANIRNAVMGGTALSQNFLHRGNSRNPSGRSFTAAASYISTGLALFFDCCIVSRGQQGSKANGKSTSLRTQFSRSDRGECVHPQRPGQS